MDNDIWNMKMAIEKAWEASLMGEVPVGSVVVDENGKILARTHNLKEREKNPCYHAEILALSEASKERGDWRLTHATLYATLEPCVMCMGAVMQSRIAHLVFGAYDTKSGAISLGFNIHNNRKLNHRIRLTGGLMQYECSRLLSDFFKLKRKFYKNS